MSEMSLAPDTGRAMWLPLISAAILNCLQSRHAAVCRAYRSTNTRVASSPVCRPDPENSPVGEELADRGGFGRGRARGSQEARKGR